MPSWFRLRRNPKPKEAHGEALEPSRVDNVQTTPSSTALILPSAHRLDRHHFTTSAFNTNTDYVGSVPERIPVELYRSIFQHISSAGSLSKLCTVSRTFRYDAERFLYHTIKLSWDYNRLLSWSKLIAGNYRLANLVRSLSLPLSSTRSGGLAVGDLEVLKETIIQAFSALAFLREFRIYTPILPGVNYLSPAMLEGHPFRLHSFEDSALGLALDAWLKFLHEQRNIQHWKPSLLANDGIDQALEEGILPLLASASVLSPILNMLASRPIQRVEIELLATPELLEQFRLGLRAITHTLTRLSLRIRDDTSGDPGRSGFGVIKVVSTEAPNLKFLGLYTTIFLSEDESPAEFIDFFTSLARLHHLEVFLLKMSGYSPTHRHESAAVYHQNEDRTFEAEEVEWLDPRPSTLESAFAFAQPFMVFCPVLKRVAFSASGAWVGGNWRGGGKIPCYVRSRSGMAEFEGFDLLGEESWREV